MCGSSSASPRSEDFPIALRATVVDVSAGACRHGRTEGAAIHRSYSLAGDHIRVSLFADRLEVESPGRLPGLVGVETIRTDPSSIHCRSLPPSGENVKSEVYLRVGDENRRLGPLEVQELRFDKGGTFYDGTACADASMSDLDDGLVRGFLKALGVTSRGEDALAARGLLVAARRRRYVPTVAGMLTLGTDPQRYFPEARLRLLRYEGTRAETGRRANVVDDVWVGGALRSQVVGARRRLRGWLRTATRLGDRGRFARSTIIPEDAWLEAIVNAVIHRSYSLAGDHIRVSLFTDRLEVESPGRLPGLVRVETIRTTRYARNPRVARAILEFGFGRELGEGVDRMFEEMELSGLPDPLFRQGPASVTVALLTDPLGARMQRVLPPGSERLVEHLLVNRRVSTAEARQLLGVSVNTARRYLTILERNGAVDHVAKSVRDPHGYWRLAGVGP